MARPRKPSTRPQNSGTRSLKGRVASKPSEASGQNDSREEFEDEFEDESEDESEDQPEVLVGEILSREGRKSKTKTYDGDEDHDLYLRDEDGDPLEDPLEAPVFQSGDRPAPLAPLRDPLQRFLAEARRYPRLSEKEERALVMRARGDDADAGRKLVVHNLRLVVSIAYQYRRTWTNMLDLLQEGSVGLVEAVKRWDPELGTRFGTYGAYWIRAYILRFLMRNARMIHVGNTRAGRKLFFQLEKARARLRAAGVDPNTKLLAADLNVSERDVEEAARALDSREVSLAPRPDGEGLSLEEKISAHAQSTPEEEASRNLLGESVRGLMEEFATTLDDPRERTIWHEHLAQQDDPVSLGTLGARFAVSKQRMGQIADRLKKRFRTLLEERIGADLQMSWQDGGRGSSTDVGEET